jgi:hypothetical protein
MDRETEASPLGGVGAVLTDTGEDREVSMEARRPPREALRAAYDAAIRDIEAGRGTHQFENGFHRQIADAVFEGCFSALEHFTAWKDERGPRTRQATASCARCAWASVGTRWPPA